ncbi:DNA-processing protein DprA [Staphylococcus pseudintermedius]|nr:DNA-processing protein DprA [Staphylococcus pseudintermedius]
MNIRNDILLLSQYGFSDELLEKLYEEKEHYLEGIFNKNSSFYNENFSLFKEKDKILAEDYGKLEDFSLVFINKMKDYKSKGVKIIFKYSTDYPSNLRNTNGRLFLYVLGNKSLIKNIKKVAIVGSRSIDRYSKKLTVDIVKNYIEKDYVTVSGMALGTDTIVHKKTIDFGGKTIAVLPTSFEHIYPSENKDIFNLIINKNGLVVTEYGPFDNTYKSNFLARNTIVAAISSELVVTKARMKSGTLNTVRKSINMKKPTYYVSGINELELENHLIKMGAKKLQWSNKQ